MAKKSIDSQRKSVLKTSFAATTNLVLSANTEALSLSPGQSKQVFRIIHCNAGNSASFVSAFSFEESKMRKPFAASAQLLLLALLTFILAISALAQNNKGAIVGTVKDPNDALVAKAQVKVTSVKTGRFARPTPAMTALSPSPTSSPAHTTSPSKLRFSNGNV